MKWFSRNFYKTESKIKWCFVSVYLVVKLYICKPLSDTSAACEVLLNYEQSTPLILDALKESLEHCHEMNVWLRH